MKAAGAYETPGGRQETTPAFAHDVAARWALRQMLAARGARDHELNGAYARLVHLHLDRHLATLRRLA